MKTLNITSYEVLNPKLAKVVASYTGNFSQDEFRDKVSEVLGFGAAAVPNSFRKVTAGVSVGFVTLNNQTRHVTPTELNASYRLLANANVYMDEEDKTLWSVKKGPGGIFLTRQGNEDLSELLASKVYHGRQDVPKVNRMTAGAANVAEFVSFVQKDGLTDYGFVVASNSQKCRVVAFHTREAQEVENEYLTSICSVKIPTELHAGTVQLIKDRRTQLNAAMTQEQKANAIEYWKALYSYAPEYLERVIQDVEAGTQA